MNRTKRTRPISREALCGEYEAVFHYVLTLTRDETAAQDVTQETFLKALRSGPGFAGNSSLYTWLCAIARHTWIDLYRKQGRETSALSEPPESVSCTVEDTVVRHDEALELHRLVHQLRDPYKEVFSLRVFGQLSFQEIAGLFEKTESWARVTYYRARKQIIRQRGAEHEP